MIKGIRLVNANMPIICNKLSVKMMYEKTIKTINRISAAINPKILGQLPNQILKAIEITAKMGIIICILNSSTYAII